MLLDSDILIDAGTGVGDLTLEEMRAIDHVFITHSHLDHIAALPLLVDSVASTRGKPLQVHATEATIRILQEHIFNWRVWPDFTHIPRSQEPYMQFLPVMVGDSVELQGRRITPIPANHVVPTVGYHLDSGRESLIFSGDTTTNDALWDVVNRCQNLRYLIIETAFPDREKDIALASKHLCPSMLVNELDKLRRPADIYVTHLKPGEAKSIMAEIIALAGRYEPRALTGGTVFDL